MQCTRQATSKDKEAISRLRINEFSRSKDFDLLIADKLKWSRVDDEQSVLAVWGNHNDPISTMRAVVVYDFIDAQKCLQCSVPVQVKYPSIVFNAAATRKQNRREGLNQVIRYHFLWAALRDGVESILSPIYIGAPRIDFMKAIGYLFATPEKNWQTKLLPKSERILGILPRSKILHAIKYLETHRSEAIDAYPWQGQMLRLPVDEAAKVTVLEKREKPQPVDHMPAPLPDLGRAVSIKEKNSQKKQ